MRSNKQRDTCVPIGISVFRKIEFEKKEREMNINTCPHVKMEKKKIIYLCLEINTTTRESYERFQGMVIHGPHTAQVTMRIKHERVVVQSRI